jgi:hypothetical protein
MQNEKDHRIIWTEAKRSEAIGNALATLYEEWPPTWEIQEVRDAFFIVERYLKKTVEQITKEKVKDEDGKKFY